MAHHHSSLLSPSSSCCSQGHSTALLLQTDEGGSICLVCLSNLISYPQKSPSIHISYALSQLSHALSQLQFLRVFLSFHSHFLISPLVHSLSSLNDSAIAQQIFDLVLLISDSAADVDCVEVYGEFVARVSEIISSGSLVWSRQQIQILHCMGVLLDHQKTNPHVYVKDKDAFVFNLITGLQLSSEEIQGEVLFVLYKVVLLQEVYNDDSFNDILIQNCAKLWHLSLQALMKTQNEDVRLNCVALLTVLARRGWFQSLCMNVNEVRWRDSFEADNFVRTTEQIMVEQPLNALFSEAIKGPLLSSDSQVQVATLDLLFLYLTEEADCNGKIQELVQENIADYVFEILRQSGCKDPLVSSCIQVLDLLSTAEQVFRQRLAIGFTTLVPILRYTTEFPFHPVQTQSIKLLCNSVSEFPGLVSKFYVEEISLILTGMVRKQLDGEAGILPETFNLACLTLIALMKCSSSSGILSFLASLRDASVNAVLNCLRDYEKHPEQLLYSLYLLKEVYAYNHEEDKETKLGVIRVCKDHILPWFLNSIDNMQEEDTILAVLETFHSLLVQDSSVETKLFADILASSSWFSRLLGCLGLFPSESMKLRVYMMFSLILDLLLEDNYGQTIRDVATDLPSDPTDLLFLLGQNSSNDPQMASSQSAVLLILYVSSLYDDSLADNKLVLASLDQYILINADEILSTTSVSIEILLNLYGLFRGLAKMSYQIPYSTEAEKILFHILSEKDWDLLSTGIHFISLKWLFQQEKIWKLLSEQMLELCRRNNLEGNHVVVYGNNGSRYIIELKTVTELMVSADNYGAMLFVCLLGDLVEQDDQEHDIISVLNTISEIIELRPDASNQLSVNGVVRSILNLYNHPLYLSSSNITMAAARLIYIFLQSVQSSLVSDEDVWASIIAKMIGSLIDGVKKNSWTEESLLVMGNLALVLHHSTNQALTESSRIILLSKPLTEILNRTISDAISRSAALADLVEGTGTVETLVLSLILIFFSMRSLQSVLPGMLDHHNLLKEQNEIETLSCNFQCHDFCKLLHFGSSPVKLISSYCLLELFNRISDKTSTKPDNSKTSMAYLDSMKAVLEGLIFYTDDMKTSINCAKCLSKLLGCEDQENKQTGIERNYWCRMIVEELALYLAVPNLTSKTFMIHHKPGVHIAVALLKLKKVPIWMATVFNDSCINAIIENISTSNVTHELVILLRYLLNSGYLQADHVSKLNQVFQACRKHLYTRETRNGLNEVKTRREIVTPDSSGKVCEFLIDLVSSLSSNNQDFFQGINNSNNRVLAEIELFSRSLNRER